MSPVPSVVLVVMVLVLALAAYQVAYPYHQLTPNKINPSTDYDYIIVGGGTAGSVLARRLSEDHLVTVLVLEAGSDDRVNHTLVDIPFLTNLARGTGFDWQYRTVAQQQACGWYTGRRCTWHLGRGLGGSSLVGRGLYIRGSRYDYDHWQDAGVEGWNYENVLPHFKKAENYKDFEFVKSEYLGDNGPLIVSDSNMTSLTNTHLMAALELGYQTNDANTAPLGKDVFSHPKTTIHRSTRWSTAHAYLRAATARDNLHVKTHAQVIQVLFDGKRAAGVEYLMSEGGSSFTRTVGARREVILCAGAVGSPQLLMLSGIGPKQHLQAMGIRTVINLDAVGSNLQDHIHIPLSHHSERAVDPETADTYLNRLQYMFTGTGILSHSPVSVVGFIRTQPQSKNCQFPDIQIQASSEHPPKNETCKESALLGNFIISAILLRPKSRGTIRLTSKTPFDHPTIDPNYLSCHEDITILLKGIRAVQKFSHTKAFIYAGIRQTMFTPSQCKTINDTDSDVYWRCLIQYLATSMNHPVGTCKMGGDRDPEAVVNSELRVRGAQALRVVDASVIPYIPSGQPLAATVMIAERAADIIKGSH